MLAGIGVDLVHIPRVLRMLSRDRQCLLDAAFHADELATWPSLAPAREVAFVAGRLAAKEAVLKALGTGIGSLWLTEIAILRSALGRPEIFLRGRALSVAEQLGIARLDLSISHQDNLAIAFVIATRRDFP